MKKIVLSFISIFLMLLSVHAQWSGDPAIANTKVCVANDPQISSNIIADGSGGAIIFWMDSRNVSGGSNYNNIYYNKLNSDGYTVWSSTSAGLALTNNTTEYNYINQVISDGSGGAFISWVKDKDGDELFVQHINSAGAKTWQTAGISLSATASYGFICSDGSGGIIATWPDYRADPVDGRPRVYAQRISSAGAKLWGTGGVQVVNTAGYSSPFGIVTDRTGGAIIAMVDTRNSNYDAKEDTYDNVDIYAQRINASGNVEWADAGVPVCTRTSNQISESDGQHPAVIADGAGGAIIAWEDFRNDPGNGNSGNSNSDIFAQRINANGAAAWAAGGVVICNAAQEQTQISLMPNGVGGAVLVWKDKRADYNIYTQKINATGAVQWATNGLPVTKRNTDFDYTASLDATSAAVLLAWADPFNAPQDIIAQKISASNGALAWGSGTLVCGRADAQIQPAITHNGGAGAIVSWTDARNSGTTGSDIYANRILAAGVLPVTLVTFNAQLTGQNVLLEWNTSSEQNSSHFEVERSADGNNFSAIGQVNAAGNSSLVKEYAFLDKEPLNGVNFYRLKMVDADEKFAYSKIVSVKNDHTNFSFKIFPNPASEILYIRSSGETKNAMIQIFDLNGKKVKEQKMISNGNGTTTVDISNLPKSIYEVVIKTNSTIKKQKLVKQ